MMIQAVLGNPHHPEYGVATIPFPIPRDQYAHCMELLEALEIGDAVKANCKVDKIDSFYTVLKRTEMLTVNVEELNYAYLIRRLTPLECERLQGFPDDWTDIPSASDSARYKALGNSVAIPCVEFIMSRIAAVLREV